MITAPWSIQLLAQRNALRAREGSAVLHATRIKTITSEEEGGGEADNFVPAPNRGNKRRETRLRVSRNNHPRRHFSVSFFFSFAQYHRSDIDNAYLAAD